MAHVLIVESNDAGLIDPVRAAGEKTGADHYADALRLADPALEVTIVAPYVTPFDPGILDGVTGAAFTGSGVSWSVDAPEGRPLRHTMEAVFAAGLPVVGSCNGMQLGALLLGGRIGASPKGMELGIARDVKMTEAGRAHAMMAGRRDGFCVPCIHRDEVQDLPAGAVLTASNDHSPIQAFSCETGGVRFWGMQYHPELPARTVAGYLRGGGTGLFAGRDADIAASLAAAETDADAANRFGTTPQELAPEQRTVEVGNWVRSLP